MSFPTVWGAFDWKKRATHPGAWMTCRIMFVAVDIMLIPAVFLTLVPPHARRKPGTKLFRHCWPPSCSSANRWCKKCWIAATDQTIIPSWNESVPLASTALLHPSKISLLARWSISTQLNPQHALVMKTGFISIFIMRQIVDTIVWTNRTESWADYKFIGEILYFVEAQTVSDVVGYQATPFDRCTSARSSPKLRL